MIISNRNYTIKGELASMKTFKDSVKDLVREKYGSIAVSENPGASACCCGDSISFVDILGQGQKCGYTRDQLMDELARANLGLGCGNPLSMARLEEGETVLDLGSGAGFDAFLAAQAVGPQGYVIGVDMTSEMVYKAQEHASALGIEHVEFRHGEIEDLPVSSDSIDVVISNCVINLSPDKHSVYREIFRVLKPGGRISISDVMLSGTMPEEVRQDVNAYTA